MNKKRRLGEQKEHLVSFFSLNTVYIGGENMVELIFEPAIVALLVGSGALCVIKGLKLIRDFIFSHLNDGVLDRALLIYNKNMVYNEEIHKSNGKTLVYLLEIVGSSPTWILFFFRFEHGV